MSIKYNIEYIKDTLERMLILLKKKLVLKADTAKYLVIYLVNYTP